MGSPRDFGRIHVAQLVSFLHCVVVLCFVCPRLVSYVSNVASLSGLSMLDSPSVFSYVNFVLGFIWCLATHAL